MHVLLPLRHIFLSQMYIFFVPLDGNMTYEIFIYLLTATQRNAGGRLDNISAPAIPEKGRKIH